MDTLFCFCDFDLDPMTSIYELELAIVKMYLHTKNELSGSRLSKVRALQTHRQTHTQSDATENITTSHPRVLKRSDTPSSTHHRRLAVLPHTGTAFIADSVSSMVMTRAGNELTCRYVTGFSGPLILIDGQLHKGLNKLFKFYSAASAASTAGVKAASSRDHAYDVYHATAVFSPHSSSCCGPRIF